MMNNQVIVIGDLMLDEYCNGVANRISPESPVPVVDSVKETHHLGGAGNVAQNVRVFTKDVTLYSSVGYDKDSEIITAILADEGIEYNLKYGCNSKTLKKTRILANEHQLCRIDSGVIKDEANAPTQSPDVIILSDYNKGTLSESYIQDIIDNNTCPVLVDPKGTDWNKYRGAFCLTPNKKEFEETYGVFTAMNALRVVKELKLDGILVTLGAGGMHWIGRDASSIYLPTEAKEVIDVTGAGDTVIATFALFLPKGVKNAMKYSNKAAGNVVSKLGTATPDKAAVKETVVFTNGCFDIIHSGHIALLQKASRFGDRLIVGLNSDNSVRRIKREPVNDMYERKAVLEAIDGVDSVIIFEDDTPYDLIKTLEPDILIKGGDYTFDEVIGNDLVENVVIIPTIEGKSTTNTIERVKNGKD